MTYLEDTVRKRSLYAPESGVIMHGYTIPPVRNAIRTAATHSGNPVVLVIKQSRIDSNLTKEGGIWKCEFLLPEWYGIVEIKIPNGQIPASIFRELNVTTYLF